MVWHSALLNPGVHFLKPNGHYNGTFWSPAGDERQPGQGPGVSEVSSMSAACEHARLNRTSHEAHGKLITIFRLLLIVCHISSFRFIHDTPISIKRYV